MMKRILSLCVAILSGSMMTSAQEVVRPVISSYMFEAGSSSILDTYLSPVNNSGMHLRFEYERMQAMRFDAEKWIMQMNAGVDYDKVHNPAGNHTEHSLMGDFRWGMMRRWSDVIVPHMQMAFGGETMFRGGVIYKPSNSNNVVSAKIHLSVGVTAMASYGIKAGNLPLTLRYQATLPMVGVFFSPGYGETYYEIYVGNRSGLAHLGWWANRFDMVNMFTVDMHLGGTVLRVGYRNRIETSWVNHLNTHIFTHAAVLGVGGEWMSLRKNRDVTTASKIISAMY